MHICCKEQTGLRSSWLDASGFSAALPNSEVSENRRLMFEQRKHSIDVIVEAYSAAEEGQMFDYAPLLPSSRCEERITQNQVRP